MSNFSEFIKRLKSNQEAFNSKLVKAEKLGASVSRSLLRDLIQDARELHEGTVVLSYILFNEEESKVEQLKIPLTETEFLVNAEKKGELSEGGDVFTEEEELIGALEDALEFTQKDIQTENMVSDITDIIEEVESDMEEEIQKINCDPDKNLDSKVLNINVEEPILDNDLPSQEEIIANLESDVSAVISRHSHNSFSLPEEEEDNSLAAKLARKKIENLNNAIGINEKFLFTNELFNGNTEQFLKTIEDLNNCVSLSEAKQKLSSVAQKRSWEVKEDTFQKLEILLSRKYQ